MVFDWVHIPTHGKAEGYRPFDVWPRILNSILALPCAEQLIVNMLFTMISVGN